MINDSGFTSFVEEHATRLFRAAYALTGASASAEDLLQETLTKLYPRWGLVAEAQSPLAYVRRCLTNEFVSAGRRPSRREIPVALVPEFSVADGTQRLSDRDLVLHLVWNLAERQRAAIVLRYLDDLPDAEIASHLGCSQATVRSLISRGISAMRAETARAAAESAGPERRSV